MADEQRDPLFRSRPCSIMRKGAWKLHHYFEDDALELYHLKNDIGEMNDLADLEKPRAEAMLGELDKWREAIKAPIPILK
jgi:arylsulfatase A-like enzyme